MTLMPLNQFCQRRPNPVFSPEYRAIVAVLIDARRRAGLSQRALAGQIGKSPSHVTMIERGQRRVDTLELLLMARAMNLDPLILVGRMASRIEELDA
jgi:transcriptional regulator with XRE-family HTH domain